MNSGVYKISFKDSSKIYIGSSANLKKRSYEHLRTLKLGKHPNRYLQRAFDSHKIENYQFEVIETCPTPNLRDREQFWIDSYKSANPNFGYNLVKDASKGGTTGYAYSEEQKRRHNEILEQRVWSKRRKEFKFINPEGEVVEVFGLRQFCIKNELPYRTMCQIHSGIGISCRGWKKYQPDGAKLYHKGSDFTLIHTDGRQMRGNNLKAACKELGICYTSIRKGFCSRGWRI